MQKLIQNLLIISIFISVFSACNQTERRDKTTSDQPLENVMDKVNAGNQHTAVVTEALDAGTYTYVKLKEDNKEYWGAITARPVQIGKSYTYSNAITMRGFESQQLGRTFDSVLFIQHFGEANAQSEAGFTPSDPHAHTKTAAQGGISVEPAKNGKTIAEIFSGKNALNEKQVTVRGQVVKISENIMKRSWIHIQDGTKSDGNYDLTITTYDPVNFKVGEVITFTGTLAVDKDFGAGYLYNVILENASWQQHASL